MTMVEYVALYDWKILGGRDRQDTVTPEEFAMLRKKLNQ
jgi:hypothetical protein